MIGNYYISRAKKSKRKKVKVVNIVGDQIQVKYLTSSTHFWYSSLDFNRLFEPLNV